MSRGTRRCKLPTIEALLRALVEAWNRGDAPAFAGLFTSQADYITGEGRWRRGLEDIADLVPPRSALVPITIEGSTVIRNYGTVATALFRWTTQPGTGTAKGIVTCVAVCQDGDWRITQLHNTDVNVEEMS